MRFDSSPHINSHIPNMSLDPEGGGSKFLQLLTISMWCYKTVKVKERYNLKFSSETTK